MRKSLFTLLRFLLSAALFLACSFTLFPLEPAGISQTLPQQNLPGSGSALNRLTEISDRLSVLNTKLQNELQDSRKSSLELQLMLEASKQELDGLKLELEILRMSSAQLLSRAENSAAESAALLTALTKAESSLKNLELSFADYRQTAQRRISSLEKENKLWKIGCITAGILAAGLGAAFLISK